VPATDLFAAAIIPGLLLSTIFTVWCLVRCWINPALGPVLPPELRASSMSVVVKDLVIGVLPVIVVILSTLGVILAGIATPTDAGAVGCAAVFVLTLLTRRMSLARIRHAAYQTLEVSSMILMLVVASNLFGSVFSRLGSAEFLAGLLTSLQLPPTMMLIVILALIFVLGWPLEWVPIVLIVVPIVLPIVQAAGIDLIWFCTLVAMTLQTAWLSPPVALSAYFLKGVVPQWSLKDIYAGMVQFMLLQMVGVGLLLMFPKLATWLVSVN
jgi:TRAP-type mannitol/chloroaromatic compound transport system permease large subunit